jgi:hypothetical protein
MRTTTPTSDGGRLLLPLLLVLLFSSHIVRASCTTNQDHCAVSTANTCSTTATYTTYTICTSVTDPGYYLDGQVVKPCTNQDHCAVSTADTCSTTTSSASKTICTSVTDPEYYLDGQVVKDCAAVADSSTRTCDSTGASGIQTVTCNTGFYQSGLAGSNLGCSACTNQANCAASSPNTCATVHVLDPLKCAVKGTFASGASADNRCTTMVDVTFGKTICTSVSANGFWLDGEVVKANNADSDGDGIPDAIERACNPKNLYCVAGRTSQQIATADSDGDLIPDYLDLDRSVWFGGGGGVVCLKLW